MTPKQELWVDMVTPSEQEPPEKGGVIFEKTLGTCHAVMGSQIQNFTLICCFFAWRRASQGLRKSLKSHTKNLKSATTKNDLTFLQ